MRNTIKNFIPLKRKRIVRDITCYPNKAMKKKRVKIIWTVQKERWKRKSARLGVLGLHMEHTRFLKLNL